MAAELDLPEIRTHALNNRGSARQHAGDQRGFDDLYASAALAEEINSPETMRAYNNLGSLLYARGDIRKCLEMEYRAIAAAERFGLATLSRFSQANVLGSTYRLGDWDVAFAGAEVVIAEGLGGVPESTAQRCARLDPRSPGRSSSAPRKTPHGAWRSAGRSETHRHSFHLSTPRPTSTPRPASSSSPDLLRSKLLERWKRADERHFHGGTGGDDRHASSGSSGVRTSPSCWRPRPFLPTPLA